MIIKELSTNGITVVNDRGQEQHLRDLAWVEGAANSQVANRQIKLALANHRTVFFNVEEGGQSLTPLEFAARIGSQIQAGLKGITAENIAKINFVFHLAAHRPLEHSQEQIIKRQVQDVFADLFGAPARPAAIALTTAA